MGEATPVVSTLAAFPATGGAQLAFSDTGDPARYQCNITAEFGISGAPDFTHAAFAELGGDAVMSD
jgi:hypothetical protein